MPEVGELSAGIVCVVEVWRCGLEMMPFWRRNGGKGKAVSFCRGAGLRSRDCSPTV